MPDEFPYAAYRDMRRYKQAEGRERASRAIVDYPAAKVEAELFGMRLISQTTGHHYALERDHWRINLYPGNQRIYHDRNRPGPFLENVPEPWSLMDIVRSAIQAIGASRQ